MKALKRLRRHINIMKKRDPALKKAAEAFLYPGLWALIFHRAARKLYIRKMIFPATLICQTGRFLTGIEIHPGAKIGRGFFIDHGAGIVIGIVPPQCMPMPVKSSVPHSSKIQSNH